MGRSAEQSFVPAFETDDASFFGFLAFGSAETRNGASHASHQGLRTFGPHFSAFEA
jgi:hypothetical protein